MSAEVLPAALQALMSPVPSTEDIRSRTEQIFSQSEFDQSPGLLERAAQAIGRFVGRIARAFSGGSGAGESTFSGAAATLLLYVALAVAAVALVWMAVVVWRHRVGRIREDHEESASEVELARPAHDWRRDAEGFEADGRWREAIRCRYRELVAELCARGDVEPVAGRTTGELRADVAANLPAAAAAFDGASLLFELPWYGGVATGPAENAQIRALAAEVLAAARGPAVGTRPALEPIA